MSEAINEWQSSRVDGEYTQPAHVVTALQVLGTFADRTSVPNTYAELVGAAVDVLTTYLKAKA